MGKLRDIRAPVLAKPPVYIVTQYKHGLIPHRPGDRLQLFFGVHGAGRVVWAVEYQCLCAWGYGLCQFIICQPETASGSIQMHRHRPSQPCNRFIQAKGGNGDYHLVPRVQYSCKGAVYGLCGPGGDYYFLRAVIKSSGLCFIFRNGAAQLQRSLIGSVMGIPCLQRFHGGLTYGQRRIHIRLPYGKGNAPFCCHGKGRKASDAADGDIFKVFIDSLYHSVPSAIASKKLTPVSSTLSSKLKSAECSSGAGPHPSSRNNPGIYR